MTVSRRDFLALTAAGLACPGLGKLAFAAEAQPPALLILLHLRGGCDGLNVISPADDPAFIEARASDLRVSADGADAGFQLANGPAAGTDFRLHTAAPGLAELYKGGRLAFMHATGLAAGNRSHFVAIDMIDRGIADNTQLMRTSSGWLTRSGRAGAGAISASGVPAGEFLGSPSAIAVPSLAGGVAPTGGPQAQAVLDKLYGSSSGPLGAAGREALAALAAIDKKLPRDGGGRLINYAPETKGYGAAGELGGPLQVIAQLVKMEVGLTTATLDLGGWDTHEAQAGRIRGQIVKLSAGLSALWEDLHRWQGRMVVVAWSEFGRRLRSNKSNGTDHGRGGVAMVLGGRVNGGRFAGIWPGLGAGELDEGVDLAVANDLRGLFTEVLTEVDGRAPGPGVFPGFKDGKRLGLFG